MIVSYLQFTYIKLNFPGNISKMSEFQPYNVENNLLTHKKNIYKKKSILISGTLCCFMKSIFDAFTDFSYNFAVIFDFLFNNRGLVSFFLLQNQLSNTFSIVLLKSLWLFIKLHRYFRFSFRH